MHSDLLTSTFMRFRARLQSLAGAIAGHDEAEDVLHDAFCKLWSRHPEVADRAEAIRLSYTSVRNAAIDRFRSAQAHQSVSMESISATAEPADDADERAQERQALCRAVVELCSRELPPAQWRVFRMHDIEGIPYEEIAEELAMRPEAVRMSLSRARKAVREIYRKIEQR